MFYLSVEFNETSYAFLWQEPGCLCCLCTSVSVGVAPQQRSFSCLIFVWLPEPNARDRKASNQHKLKQPLRPFVWTLLARTKQQNTEVPVTFFLVVLLLGLLPENFYWYFFFIYISDYSSFVLWIRLFWATSSLYTVFVFSAIMYIIGQLKPYIPKESNGTASNITVKVRTILQNLGRFSSLLNHPEGFTTIDTVTVWKC